MTDSPAQPPGVPADRYGRRSASRKVLIPLATVLAATGVAGAGYAAWVTSHRASGKVVTFQTADDGVQITANIRREPGKETECALRARNRDGAEVGRRVIVVPAAPDRHVTVSEFLQTSERPITGEIMECRARP